MRNLAAATYTTFVLLICIFIWAKAYTRSRVEKIQPYIESINTMGDIKKHSNFVPAEKALQPMLLGSYSCTDYKASNNTCTFISSWRKRDNHRYFVEKTWLFKKPVLILEISYTYAFSDGFLCISKEDYEIEFIQNGETIPIFEQGEIDKFFEEIFADVFKNGEPCIGYLNTEDGLIAITFEENGIWDKERYDAHLVTFHPRSPYYRLYNPDEFGTQ